MHTTERGPAPATHSPYGPALVLNPAVRVLWRSAHEVQLELGAEAVVVSGVDSAFVRAIVRPTATNSIDPRLVEERTASHRDLPAAPALPPGSAAPGGGRQALRTLVDAGYLWVLPADPAELLAPPRPRLSSELTALATSRGQQAAEILAARRDRTAVIFGDSALASLTAILLAGAGIGRVHHAETSHATLAHLQAAFADQSYEGRPLRELTNAAIARAAPEVQTLPLPLTERPDLVVLAYDRPVDPERLDALRGEEQPHLSIGVARGSVIIGPLVVPGLTSCLSCIDLHRMDRDPAWQALAVQLGVRRSRHGSCPGWLLNAGAAQACREALSYLDGADVSVIDATVELTTDTWHARRRSWPAHPDCGCRL